MDTHRSEILRETIRKEMKLNSKHLDEMRRMKGLAATTGSFGTSMTASAGTLPPLKKQSAINRQLDQTMGLSKDPHTMTKDEWDSHGMTADDFLRTGVSHEGQGRKAYLKHQVKHGGPRERFGGQPLLSSHEVGWTVKDFQVFGTSQYARRPLVKQQFYRTMGVSLSAGGL